MSLADRYDVLFEPITVGPKTARNRFWQTPHASGFGSDYPGSQRAYREAKAEGGWGVVFTEATSIAPEVDKSPARLARLWDEGDVRNARHVVEGIHAHGALAGIELEYHSSIGFMTDGRGLNARGVMTISGESSLPVAYAGSAAPIELEDIAELQELHVAAALRARDAGFDLITFHCGHAASLFAHFLIPYYNDRTDEYGGSFENRARFARETMAKVRAALGDSAAVGIRFGVDTLDEPIGLGERGIRSDGEAPLFVEHMDDLVDYWDFVVGGYDWGQDAQSSRTASENWEAPYVAQLKKHSRKPVVNVGRLNSPDTMVDVVRSGQCDFIGAARASISDPFLPEKIRSGRIEDIRECIGCNICVSRDMGSSSIQCTQNATIGEEFRRGWHPERYDPVPDPEAPVLIVGAGPAGMECALVLARRGVENVHLVDATDALGGCLNWVTRLPGRQEWRRLVEYRELQLSKLSNVTTILNTTMTCDDVLDYGAETVVIATGSSYRRGGLNPFDRKPWDFLESLGENLLTPEQVIEQGLKVEDDVVVIDTDGYFVGPGIAEKLARQGHRVTVVTPAVQLGQFLHYTKELTRQMIDLRALGIDVHTGTTVTAVDDSGVHLSGAAGQRTVKATSVVLVGQRQSHSALYRGLRNRRTEWESNGLRSVHQIGDAVRPHLIADAIFSGHRLAREIEQPDPMRQLPFVRERRIISSTDADFVVGGQASLSIY